MFARQRFILAHQMKDPRFLSTYHCLVRNQWKSPRELREEQDRRLRSAIRFACEHVPFYARLFRELRLSPEDIRCYEDLEKLPILTKKVIREHQEEFRPTGLSSMHYKEVDTSGSTGTPLRFRLLERDRFIGAAIMYRGWGYGGYQMGDPMILIGGSALGIHPRRALLKDLQDFFRNVKSISAFQMAETDMVQYLREINSFSPRFLRGYTSAIYFLSKWLLASGMPVHQPDAIFTTAEKLTPEMRKTIEDAFHCEVFDNYGLNDGGVSTFECAEHTGLHVDTERSILEVVDASGNQIAEGQGQIVATSLWNRAMPFIRYDTGDLGHATQEPCPCGRGFPLLKEIVGRTVDVFLAPNGAHVYGAYFGMLLEKCQRIKAYQVIQERVDTLHVRLIPDGELMDRDIEKIRRHIQLKDPSWKVEIDLVNAIETTGSGKYRFLINRLEEHR
jgi:phenylacetate-coenzyme A ligase PaaK-like adenylate-forming protein